MFAKYQQASRLEGPLDQSLSIVIIKSKASSQATTRWQSKISDMWASAVAAYSLVFESCDHWPRSTKVRTISTWLMPLYEEAMRSWLWWNFSIFMKHPAIRGVKFYSISDSYLCSITVFLDWFLSLNQTNADINDWRIPIESSFSWLALSSSRVNALNTWKARQLSSGETL